MSELAVVLAGGAATLLAVRRARGRLRWGAAAVAVGWAATLGPLDPLAERSLAAHMLQHVLLGDLAPLLVVLAARSGDLRRLAPHPAVASLLDRLFRPLPAFAVWAGALALWHVPSAYDLALEHERVHALEHAAFALGGLLVWSQLLDPARRRRLAGWWLPGYALAVLVASQALANVLVLSYRPLYGAYAGADRPFGLSATGDQDAGAVVMMLEQLATVGTFAFLALRSLVARTAPRREAPHPFAA
ncbi:MAG TPA: cytochrome c oxidase assembly protein [Gaiellaceae bacterium]|nr:cytochrome c oxidase assembly protein [Gaiellaceae bacterium]